MPQPPELFERNQYALLWKKSGDDDDGRPSYAPLTELSPDDNDQGVRWEQVDRETLDAKGNTVKIDAVVVVDRKIPVDSLMWQGSENMWYGGEPGTGSGSGGDDIGLYQVVAYKETPDIDGIYVRRTVELMKYKDQIP